MDPIDNFSLFDKKQLLQIGQVHKQGEILKTMVIFSLANSIRIFVTELLETIQASVDV